MPRKALRRCGESGRRAAAQGVALRALLDLHLSAAWRLWRHLPPVAESVDGVAGDPAAVVRAGEVMLRAVDDAVAALTEGYQLARREVLAEQTAARREFVDDLLLGGTQAAAGLAERAGTFGLNLAGPHAVVVVRAQRPSSDSSSLTSLLERSVLRQQGGCRRAGDHEGRRAGGGLRRARTAPPLDQVVERPDRPPFPRAGRRGSAAQGRAGRVSGGWASAGRCRARRVSGSPTSRRSRRSIWASGWDGSDRVLDAAGLLLYRVLMRDEAAMRDLVDAVLAPWPPPGVARSRCCGPWRHTSAPAAMPRSPPGRCTCRCVP